MAILFGDIAGYSRLIEIDDVGTVARLRLVRQALFDPTAALFHAALIRHTADFDPARIRPHGGCGRLRDHSAECPVSPP